MDQHCVAINILTEVSEGVARILHESALQGHFSTFKQQSSGYLHHHDSLTAWHCFLLGAQLILGAAGSVGVGLDFAAVLIACG